MSEVIKIEGLARMKANLERAGTKIHDAAVQAVADEVEEIQRDARRLAPTDTGKLRRDISAEDHELKGEVRSKVRYSKFVEHGTSKAKAQPFMMPASMLARRRLPKRARELIKIALEGIR